MTPTELAEAIRNALHDAVATGEINVEMPAVIQLERPKNRDHGDYASNVAMQLAGAAGMAPRKLAETITARLAGVPGVASVAVAGPGFINIKLEPAAQGDVARRILAAGAQYGRAAGPAGQSVNLEFVSANPTGPLHIGAARWAAVGDALARILEAAGARVTKEYYFNDAGAQIDRFAEALIAAASGLPAPEGSYQGSYIPDLARQIIAAQPEALNLPENERLEIFKRQGVALMFAEIKDSLARFGVSFDVYRNEKDLRDSGSLGTTAGVLAGLGHTYEAGGALWLRTTEFGDDKDRVLVKSDGSWTYFAADCAYYRDKKARAFDRLILILGADHHGYVARMKAVASCFGDDPADVEILIGQFVNLLKDGRPVRLSKRAGDVVTMDDLIEAVGVDAARYSLARASIDSAIDLDVTQLTAQTAANPVYYVQYAYARLCALMRNADKIGLAVAADFDAALLDHERESELLGALAEFPGVVASAAELREVHRVARYLENLAGSYHRWYDACRVLPYDGEPAGRLTMARLCLAEAARIVIRNGLTLLGVSAPERM